MHRRRILDLALSSSSSSSSDNEEAEAPVFSSGVPPAHSSSSKVTPHSVNHHHHHHHSATTTPFVPSSPSPASLPLSSSSRLNRGAAAAGTTATTAGTPPTSTTTTTTAKATLSSIITSAMTASTSSSSTTPLAATTTISNNKPIMMNRSPPRSPTIEPVRDPADEEDTINKINPIQTLLPPPRATTAAAAMTQRRRAIHEQEDVESIVVTTSAPITHTATSTAHLKGKADDDGDDVTATATNYTYPVLSPKITTSSRGRNLGGGEGASTEQLFKNDNDDRSRAASLAATETAHNGNSPMLLRVEHDNNNNNKSRLSSDSESDDASSINFTRMATTSAASLLRPAPATTTTTAATIVGSTKTTVATTTTPANTVNSSAHSSTNANSTTSSTNFMEMRSSSVSHQTKDNREESAVVAAPLLTTDPTLSLTRPQSFNPTVPQTISVDPSLFKTPQRRTLVGKSMRVSTTSISEPLPTEKIFVVKSPTHYTDEELLMSITRANKENQTGETHEQAELAGKELHAGDNKGANLKNTATVASVPPPAKTTIRKVVKKKVMVKRKKNTNDDESAVTTGGKTKNSDKKKDRELKDESDRREESSSSTAATAARRKLLLGMKMSDSDSDSEASSSSSSEDAYEEEIEEEVEENEGDKDKQRTADSISVATTLFTIAANASGEGEGEERKRATARGSNNSILLPTSNKYTPTTTPTIRTPVGEEETEKEVFGHPEKDSSNGVVGGEKGIRYTEGYGNDADDETKKRQAARAALEQQLKAAGEARRLALLEKEKAEAEILLTLQRRQKQMEEEEEEVKNKKSRVSAAIVNEKQDHDGEEAASKRHDEKGVRETIDLDSHTEGEEDENEEDRAEREKKEVEHIRQSYVPTFSSYEKVTNEVSLSSDPAAFRSHSSHKNKQQGLSDENRRPRLPRASSSSSSDSSSSSPFILTKAEYHAALDDNDASTTKRSEVKKEKNSVANDDQMANAVTNTILQNIIDTHNSNQKKRTKENKVSSKRSSSSPILRGGKDNDDSSENENEPLTVLVQKSATWDRLRASQRRVESEVPDAHSDTARLYLVMNRLMKAASGDDTENATDDDDDDEVRETDFSEENEGGANEEQTKRRMIRERSSSFVCRRAWGSRAPFRLNGTAAAAKSAVTLLKDTSQMILYANDEIDLKKRNRKTQYHHDMVLYDDEENGQEVVESRTSNGVYGKCIADIVSENAAPRTVLSFSNKTLASAVADAARRANTNVSSGLSLNGKLSTDGLLINRNNNHYNDFDTNTTSHSLSKSLVAPSDVGGKSEPLNASSAPLAAYLRVSHLHQHAPQDKPAGKEKTRDGLAANPTNNNTTSTLAPSSSSATATATTTVDIASILERRRQRISQAVGQKIVGGGGANEQEELSADNNNNKAHSKVVGMPKKESGVPFIKTTTLFDDGQETDENLPHQNDPKSSSSRLSAAEPTAHQTTISSNFAATTFSRELFAPVKIIDDLVAADAAMQRIRDEEMRKRIEHIEEMKRLHNTKAAKEQLERLRKEEACHSFSKNQNAGHQGLEKKKDKRQLLHELQTNIGGSRQKKDTGDISPSSARTALSARRTRGDSQMIADTLLRPSNDAVHKHRDDLFPKGKGKVEEEEGRDEKNFGLTRHQQKTHIGVSDFDVRVDLFAEERGLERVLLGHAEEVEEALLIHQQKRQSYALPITFSSSEKGRSSSDDVHHSTSTKAKDEATPHDHAISLAHYTSTLAVSGLHARRPVTKKVGHDGIAAEYERDHTYPNVSMGLLSPTKKAEIQAEEKRREEHLRVLAVASAIVREEKKKDSRPQKEEEGERLLRINERPLPTEAGALIATSPTTGHRSARESAVRELPDRIESVTRLESDEDMDDLAARTAADLKALLALKTAKRGSNGSGLYAVTNTNNNGQDTRGDSKRHQIYGNEANKPSGYNYYSDPSPSSSSVTAPSDAIRSVANDDTKPQSKKGGLYQELVEGVSTFFAEGRTATQSARGKKGERGSAHYELYESALNNASRKSESRSASPPNASKHSGMEVGGFTLDAHAPTRGPSAMQPMDEHDKLYQNKHITSPTYLVSGGDDNHHVTTGMQQQQQQQPQRDREREREAYIKRVTAETLAAIAAAAAPRANTSSATSYSTSTFSSAKAAVPQLNSAEPEVATTITMRERDMNKINSIGGSDKTAAVAKEPLFPAEKVKFEQIDKKEEKSAVPKTNPATNQPSSSASSSLTYSYATHRTTVNPTGGDLTFGITRSDTNNTNNNNHADNNIKKEKFYVPLLEPLTISGDDRPAPPQLLTATDYQPKTPTAFETSTMSMIPTLEATKLTTVTHHHSTTKTIRGDETDVTSSSVIATTTGTANLGVRRELDRRVADGQSFSVDIGSKRDLGNALDNLKLSASPAPRPVLDETFSYSHIITNDDGFKAKDQDGEEKEKRLPLVGKEARDEQQQHQQHFSRNLIFQYPSLPPSSFLTQAKAEIHTQTVAVASPLMLSDSDVGPMSLSATVAPPQPLLSSEHVLDVDQQRIRVATRRPPPAPTPSPPNDQSDQREQQYANAGKKSESAILIGTSGRELIAADRKIDVVAAHAPPTTNHSKVCISTAATSAATPEAVSSIGAATAPLTGTQTQTALTTLGDGRTPPPRRRVPPPPPTFD